MRAPAHPQQAARLAALRRYDILDTPREAAYDEVVDLIAKLCDAPIAVINLIDADRQWFKAEVGLGVRETPLETSLCAHVILENSFVEIPDTLADPRMRDNPLCLEEPGLRFYAGALLTTGDGHPIGTLCVLDHRPRRLTPLQREAMQVMATQVMRQIELAERVWREALLRKEIDHRVKNSLQSIAAYVSMRKRVSEFAAEELGGVQRHIDAVAGLHAHLAHPDEDGAGLDGYFARIVSLLDQASPTVTVSGSFETVPLSSQRLGLVGTILNELVANMLKHDFADGGTGNIILSGRRAGDDYALVCEGDAPSRPANDNPADRSASLGLRIIEASVRGLGGTIAVTRTPHYRTEIRFPA